MSSVEPLHYGANLEIDTTWTADTGAWQWKLTQGDYQAHARNIFNVGNLTEWRIGSSWVIFDPQSINFINQDTSRQQIAIKQAITGVVNDCRLHFQNGYGTGRHFTYEAHPSRLKKLITIDNLANLPVPTVTGTVWFEAEFSLSTSSDVALWLDGVKWAKTNNVRVQTSNQIEFRDDATGTQVLWLAEAPTATDADGKKFVGAFEVRRQSTQYFITVRIPYTWIAEAHYPIYIDPTLTTPQDSTVADTMMDANNATTTYETSVDLWAGAATSFLAKSVIEWDLSSIGSGAIYTSITASLWTGAADYFDPSPQTFNLRRVLDANASWTEAGACWSYRVGSTAWAGSAGCSTSGTDYSATSMGTTTVASEEAANTRHDITLDATEFEAMRASNNGLVIFPASSVSYWKIRSSDYGTSTYRPLLVVEYTTGVTVNLSAATLSSSAPAIDVDNGSVRLNAATITASPQRTSLVSANGLPTFVSAYAVNDITVATRSWTVTKPTNAIDGDLIVIFFVTNTTANLSVPTNWFRAGSEVDTSTDMTTNVIYKIASGEGSSWTFTNLFDATEIGRAVALAYRNVDQTTPVNQANQASSSSSATSVSGPSITPNRQDCLIVQFVGADPGTGAYAATPDTSPIGTERFDGKDGSSNAYVAIQEYQQSTAGAIALDYTGLTADYYGYHQIAIAPRGGAVVLAVDPVGLAATPAAITIDAPPVVVTVQLTAASLATSAPGSSVIPGAISVALSAAGVVASADVVGISAPITPTTVVLTAATLAAQPQAAPVVPGAISAVLAASSLLASPQAATTVPGAVSVLLTGGGISASAGATTIIPGAISATLVIATITASATQTVNVIPGAVAVVLNVTNLVASPQNTTVDSAIPPTNVALQVVTIIAQAQATTAAPGAVGILLGAATTAASPQGAAIVPGAVSAAVNAVSVTASPQTAVAISGAVSVVVLAATVTAVPQTAAIVPGAVSVQVAAAVISSSGGPATSVPGAVSVAIGAAAMVAAPQTTAISTLVLPVTVTLNASTINALAQASTVVPGAISTSLNPAELAISSQMITAAPGAATVILTAASITAAPGSVNIIIETVVSLNSALVIGSAGELSIVPGDVACVLNAAILSVNTSTIVVLMAVMLTLSSRKLRLTLFDRDNRLTLLSRKITLSTDERSIGLSFTPRKTGFTLEDK